MTDTMLFGILKMPFEMAMSDEISRLQYYARVQELVGRFEAQQQAEPVAYFDFQEQKFSWAKHMKIGPVPVSIKVEPMKLYSKPPQQQAEPVAWMYSDDYERMTTSETFCTVFSVEVGSPDKGVTDIQLYTAPPQRKELSASEILNMMPSAIPAEYDGELMEFARAVEAKLKERNGY